MTATQIDIFQCLSSLAADRDAILDQAVDHFRKTRSAMELFEAIKMRIRHRLGLPLVAGENDVMRSEDIERQLESGLLDACREAGTMLIEDGKVGEGWMYLRPLADLQVARDLLSEVEITDDNYDEMIQVLLHEGVDVGRGYQAILDHQGTCNSITIYEQAIVSRSKADRQAAAERLLHHFYGELSDLVREDIKRRDSDNPDAKNEDGSQQSLGEMVTTRKWLLADGGYHLDTTHLAATVRIGSVLDQPVHWEKLRELTQYGRRLNQQFQYPGEEPFVDFYPAYGAFYDVLLGSNVESGLKLFERKATTVDVAEHGTAAIETYVDLLDRTGRHGEAIQAAIRLVPSDVPTQRIVPMLLEIAARSGNSECYPLILQLCQERNDVLGFAAVLHAQGAEA